jgi:hypothetical protein
MDAYFKALRDNLEVGLRGPCVVELIASLDAAYQTVVKPPPKGQLIFGRFLLICHKSMLSAAALIAQTQPEDSVGVTRRAIEVARVALAIKLNDQNALQWTSYQERHDRWIKRQHGEKPKSFRVEFAGVKGDALIEELDRWLGVLSDAYVHFTPEFYDSLDWDERIKDSGDGEIFLNYFHRSQREIERHFNTLAAVHVSILKAFDRCFDGGISTDAEKIAAVNHFWKTAKKFNDDYQERYGEKESPIGGSTS